MPSIPAHATEAPSINKVWQQFKDNIPTFATVHLLLFIALLMHVIATLLFNRISEFGPQFTIIPIILSGYLPTTILVNLVLALMTAVAAIYYATDHCPSPGETLFIITRKPLRYLMAGLLFFVVEVIGLLFCVIPGILVTMSAPIYIHHVFTTDLELMTCLSKSLKAMFQDFIPYLVATILCGLAVFLSALCFILPVLAVWPMTTLYMQNYIHHKGLVSPRELA